MAISRAAAALFFTLAFTMANVVYTSQVLKGSITCLDCPRNFDLSGHQILVKCDKVKKLVMTYTQHNGTFETELPSDGNSSNSGDPGKCMAKIMGGPHQLYIPTNNAVIPVAKSLNESGQFTVPKPLCFYKTCPPKAKCDAKDLGFLGAPEVADDLPVPGQGGLPPPRDYIPFIPIIGIP